MRRIVTAKTTRDFFHASTGRKFPAGTKVEIVSYAGRTTNTDEPLDWVRFLTSDPDEVLQDVVLRSMLTDHTTEDSVG